MKKGPLKRRKTPVLWLIVFLLTLDSCIGVSADIQMRGDGSGKITVEYRFSRMAETIGRLDGNEQWHIIPVGRADLERTLARIPGMRLVSFSSREQDKDIVNNATLEFKNTEALLSFLDPSGRRACFSSDNGSNRLDITLNAPASSQVNPDLSELMKQVSAGYKFRMSFSAEGDSAMTLTGGAGEALPTPPQAQIVPSGKKVSLEMGTGDIPDCADGLAVSFFW